jgi:hypothetical protein
LSTAMCEACKKLGPTERVEVFIGNFCEEKGDLIVYLWGLSPKSIKIGDRLSSNLFTVKVLKTSTL